MIANNTNFGKEFRAIRKKMKLCQTEAGELTGLSINSISAYENGKVNFTIYAIWNFCNAYNVDPNIFVRKFDWNGF